MVVIDLHEYFFRCPKYWQNFIKSLQKNDRYKEIPITELNKELEKYNAEYDEYNDVGIIQIKFEDEEDLSAFILSWA